MNIHRLPSSLAILAVGLADAVCKTYAIHLLPGENEIKLQSILAFALHRNPGIAFDIPVPFTVVLPITAVACGILLVISYRQHNDNPKQSLAALAAVTGAVGNGLDRLVNGFTTDYIILFRTSAINLSDVLILVGIAAVLWYDKRIPSRA